MRSQVILNLKMTGSGWKDYLTFSRKERTGILVLLGLILIIYAVPGFLPEKRSVKFFYNRDSLQDLSTLKNSHGDQQAGGSDRNLHNNNLPAIKPAEAARFAFDPNNLDEDGWKRLGVHERTIRTIMNFRSKGGKFRLPSDLRKIYGMNENICEELIPFVRIQKIPAGTSPKKDFKNYTERNNHTDFSRWNNSPEKKSYEPGNYSNSRNPGFKEHTVAIKSIDINLSDSVAWEQLPAIGSKLAARIIIFRERLGGFYNVHQVAETFGISDSAFKIILPYLTNSEKTLRKININEVAAPDLARHPYIRWNIANAIVNYRNQHGTFRDISELKAVSVVSPDVFEKLKPYLTVQ